MPYPELPQDAVALEEEILERWTAEQTFRRSLQRREGAPAFVFYEGPPTANGRPGVHHIISRTIKDAVARHRAMSGFHVTRIAGWDTHGLPVELEAERRLGISGKPEIERIGIAEFNRVCRESLFTYKEEWERLSARIGYWLDYDRPYITCSPDYIESVWWALAEIDRRGLLYRGNRIVPYCPRCGTGLSSHEVALGYAERTDPSLYVRFPIVEEPGDGGDDRENAPPGRSLLIWTTTPWTLVSNVAVAFDPGLEYVEVEEDEGRRMLLSRGRAAALFGEEAIGRTVPTAELTELRYRRPLRLLPDFDEETGRMWPAGFVSDEEGTGLVHIAPAFGADDFALGQEHGLPVVRPVDDEGRFVASVREVGGELVKDADAALADLLRDRGLIHRAETVSHSYPHCWRCDTPLLYMARDSWYVATTAVKERLLEHNAAVDWHPPEIGSGRMGEWLENNVDWAISRDRYWGTPLPIWVCSESEEHREVIGSFGDLAERAGPLPEGFDPHRPGIDQFSWFCRTPGCAGEMRRVPEVMDAWFDSGSMPYAQWHFPFENEEAFHDHFPADFIAEGVDQTRGWFYSLMALSTLLFDRTAYRAVVVNDLVLDEHGLKMSKSRGNVVDPWQAIAAHGADAIRFYVLSASNPWIPKRWDPEGLAEVDRKLFDTLRNTYRFFVLYAGLEGWSHPDPGAAPPEGRPLLDRWLLARLDGVTGAVAADMAAYDLTRAARRIADFVVNDVSNWYVRRSRERFWASRPGSAERLRTADAFSTLHDVLVDCARLLAPFAPFLSDWLHRALTGESVHVADLPETDGRSDPELEREIRAVRRLAALGRAAREQAGIRVRQPLRTLRAALPGGGSLSEPAADILRQELNVKGIVFSSANEQLIRFSAKPDYAKLGPRFGSRTRAVAKAIEDMNAELTARLREGHAVTLAMDGGAVELGPGDVRLEEEARGDMAVQAEDGYVAALDPRLDEELVAEGMARELVSRVQRLRRDAGLRPEDRIRLGLAAPARGARAAGEHRQWIADETLAVEFEVGEAATAGLEHAREIEIDGEPMRIGLARAEARS